MTPRDVTPRVTADPLWDFLSSSDARAALQVERSESIRTIPARISATGEFSLLSSYGRRGKHVSLVMHNAYAPVPLIAGGEETSSETLRFIFCFFNQSP